MGMFRNIKDGEQVFIGGVIVRKLYSYDDPEFHQMFISVFGFEPDEATYGGAVATYTPKDEANWFNDGVYSFYFVGGNFRKFNWDIPKNGSIANIYSAKYEESTGAIYVKQYYYMDNREYVLGVTFDELGNETGQRDIYTRDVEWAEQIIKDSGLPDPRDPAHEPTMFDLFGITYVNNDDVKRIKYYAYSKEFEKRGIDPICLMKLLPTPGVEK